MASLPFAFAGLLACGGAGDLDEHSAPPVGGESTTDPGTGGEQDGPGICTRDGDCPGGMNCLDGVCVEKEESAGGGATEGNWTTISVPGGGTVLDRDIRMHVWLPGEDNEGEGETGGGSVEPTPGLDLTPTEPHTGPVRGRLAGRVKDLVGMPLDGVQVTLEPGWLQATTGIIGRYVLKDVTPGDYVAHFTRRGFLEVHRRVEIAGWERVVINAVLKQAAPPQLFDADQGGTLRSGEVAVSIPPGAFVDERGTPVTYNAEAHITPLDPTTDDIEAAPGDFVGEEATGDTAPLVSYAMADISFVQAGSPLQLAPSASARLELPVPVMPLAVDQVFLGDEIPLWWFDPARAVWVREGTARVELAGDGSGRLVFAAEVAHFTPWNVDKPAEPVCVEGEVVDCTDYPIPGAEVRLTGPGVTSSATTRTDANGRYRITGAARGEAIVEARVSMGDYGFSATSGPISVTSSDCVEAPDIPLEDVRYLSGIIELIQARSRWWAGAMEMEQEDTTGIAIFWDVDDAELPAFIACTPPPQEDNIVSISYSQTPPQEEIPLLDIGNPIVLEDGSDTLPLYRNYVPNADGDLELGPYISSPNAPLWRVGPREVDMAVPGAAGSLPQTVKVSALQVPDELVVTSPAQGSARTFDRANGIPLNWGGTPGPNGLITLAMIPLQGGSEMLFGTLVDDGSYELSTDELQGFTGEAMIVLSRSTERFEHLPTGPSVMLEGIWQASFNVEVR